MYNKDYLQEVTMKLLFNKLTEGKTMITNKDFAIDSDWHAEYWGIQSAFEDIKNINKTTSDTDERIKYLNDLLNKIDTDVTKYDDYELVDDKYIPLWLKGYKDNVKSVIQRLSNKGKYYIVLRANYSDNGDVDHRSCDVSIENGNITKGTRYYDDKSEAENAVRGISKKDIEDFRRKNMDSEYKPLLDWSLDIEEYEPDIDKF